MSISAEVTNPAMEALVGRVADDFTQRFNRGERPSVDEYVANYPEIADVLRVVLPALKLIPVPDVEAALAEDDPNLAAPLGDFCLVRKIGQGGMGVVYEAKQISLNNRTVAVKTLPIPAALDPRLLQRFKNEAKAAASLKHPNIVPVYYVGCERGVHFYAMQYIDGLSLAVIIAEIRRLAGVGPADPQRTMPYFSAADTASVAGADTLSLAELTTEGSVRSRAYFDHVARLGLQAAKGLEHAHQELVWHRDIKPGNLIVDHRGNLWIADFGLAQIRSDLLSDPQSLTPPGQLIGTYRYMSPEQALAKRVPIDHRTDIYSLGATLYEMLTLEPIFKGNDAELLRQIVFDDPRPLRRLNRAIPRDLETIVMTALAKSPAQRYASAKEMAEDLYRFLNDQPIKYRPEGWLRWLRRKSRRHASRLLLSLSIVVTLVVLSILLVFLNAPSAGEREQKIQQEALTSHSRDLDFRKKVTLIEAQGRSGYFRWLSDENAGKILSIPDGAFSVQNWEYGLLELLPDPRQERYRFSAEVRHERQADQESRVGIYFGYSEHEISGSWAYFHCNIAFNDLVDLGAKGPNGVSVGNSVGPQLHRQSRAGLLHEKAELTNPEWLFVPARPVGAFGPWRKIAVEVSPQAIQVHWDAKPLPRIARETIVRCARRLIVKSNQPLPAEYPKFEPRGGLGLYVSLGVASFRNVIVEPLGDEN